MSMGDKMYYLDGEMVAPTFWGKRGWVGSERGNGGNNL